MCRVWGEEGLGGGGLELGPTFLKRVFPSVRPVLQNKVEGLKFKIYIPMKKRELFALLIIFCFYGFIFVCLYSSVTLSYVKRKVATTGIYLYSIVYTN